MENENKPLKKFRDSLSKKINDNLTNELRESYTNSNLNFAIDYPYVIYREDYGINRGYIDKFSLSTEDTFGRTIPQPLYDFYVLCFKTVEITN